MSFIEVTMLKLEKKRIDIIMTHGIGIFELQMSTSLQDEKVTGNVLEYLFS